MTEQAIDEGAVRAAGELLDEVLELGQAELESLIEGNVEQAEEVARERGERFRLALDQIRGEPMDELLPRLIRLRELHTLLAHEVRRLRDALKEDMARNRQESRRFAGYRYMTKVTPLHGRHVSRRG